ncbi:MAG: DUF58 domain-containing protein [Candidatus Omnitrophota bacterium]
MVTERGKLLLIILGICLIIAWYTQFGLIYLICALLSGILLSSFIFFKITLINVNCLRQIPNAAYEDETVKVKIILENRSIFTNYFICLMDHFPADLPEKQEKKILIPTLPRRRIIEWDYEGKCFKRGAYWVGPFTLIGSDPLGLFKKYKIINVSSKLTVYPQLFNIHYLPPFTKGIVTPRYGTRTSRRSGEYEEFYGIREYRQEDGLRKIHWPSSAKHNELIVRHFEQSSLHSITIALDLKKENNLGAGKETTLEYSVKIAASFAKYFLDQGSVVQLLGYGDKLIMSALGHDPSHFFSILELLARMESNGYYSLGEALTMLNPFIPHASTLVVIRLDKDLEAAKASEQITYTKNISIIEVQLNSFSFDKNEIKNPDYNIQTKVSDILCYKISCKENLETSFSSV